MKVLVGNNTFAFPGGSETYNFALIQELVRRGHEVDALAGNKQEGKVSNHLKAIGVKVHFQPIKGDYDLVLASHSTSIAKMGGVKGFKVQTCHGIYPKVEQPVAGMDAYVAISDEVKGHLDKLGHKSTVILNGVDCDRFEPKKPLNATLKTVLSLAHSDPANVIIKAACDIAKVDFIENNKHKVWKWDMENLIGNVDLVVSLGRGAYESMAAGRNVVIFDKRNYTNLPAVGDGIITKDTVDDYLRNNCSGRFTMRKFDAKILAEEFQKYDPMHGEVLREYALNNLNIQKQTDLYLNLLS